MIKFSIITVCLNAGQDLIDTVENTLNQSYDNFEIIVKDGFSKDGSIEKLPYNDKIKLIQKKDTGIYDAMNQGIEAATGDYLIFMNCGDWFYDGSVLERIDAAIKEKQEMWACELVAIVMEKTGIQWCTGIPCHYNERGVAHNVPRITPVFPRNFIRKGYMDGRVATFLEQESMFWSKNLWDKAGHVLVQYKTAGDYHLWKEFAKYEALYTLDSVISGFRIHAGQKSGDRNKYYAEVGENSLCGKLLQKSKLIKVLCCIESFTFSKYRIKTRDFLV